MSTAPVTDTTLRSAPRKPTVGFLLSHPAHAIALGFGAGLSAIALFRYFDAAKPGPVAWADALFKERRSAPVGWVQGFGILFDDLVAALCTLLVIALWRW